MIRSMFALSFTFLLIAPSNVSAQHKYVGVKMCAPCHRTEKQGNQLAIWQSSKHAEAYKVLESDASKEIAKKKGLSKAPAESPECLKCHVPQHDVEAALISKTFDPKDGVQCESCHGPGSDYKSLSVMKDRTKALAAGMVLAKDDPKLCQNCHNEESPTFKAFDYKKMWEKIKHPVPTAKK